MYGLGPTWVIKSKADRCGLLENCTKIMEVRIFGVRFANSRLGVGSHGVLKGH